MNFLGTQFTLGDWGNGPDEEGQGRAELRSWEWSGEGRAERVRVRGHTAQGPSGCERKREGSCLETGEQRVTPQDWVPEGRRPGWLLLGFRPLSFPSRVLISPLRGPQAIWTRFFPAIEALRAALAQGTLGDLRVAHAEFGKNLTHVPRSIDWAQAGGALLDLGIYCVQFISMVFGRQKPEKISAVGRRYETGTVWPGLADAQRSDPLFMGAPS